MREKIKIEKADRPYETVGEAVRAELIEEIERMKIYGITQISKGHQEYYELDIPVNRGINYVLKKLTGPLQDNK